MDDHQRKELLSCLHSFFDIDAVYLYGSQAKGYANEQSDYDIAILCPYAKIPDWESKMAAQSELEDILKREVDLLILNDAGPIIAMQAVQGLLLEEHNQLRHQQFITHLYSMYAEFKELQAPMEKNILKRKFYDK